MFYFEIPNNIRAKLINQLREDVILTSHYLPLHLSKKGLEFKRGDRNFKESINLSEKILRFPVHSNRDVGETEIYKILEILDKYFSQMAS